MRRIAPQTVVQMVRRAALVSRIRGGQGAESVGISPGGN
jgi:hypothetical protein